MGEDVRGQKSARQGAWGKELALLPGALGHITRRILPAIMTMDTKAEEIAPDWSGEFRRQSQAEIACGGTRCGRGCALVWALLLWLSVSSSWAAVRFDVFIGYDGVIPEASWFPVSFEIFNDGPSLNGVVEISPGQFNQGLDHRLALELPTGTTKRFTIPVFAASRAGAYGTWDARLLDEKGRVRAESLGLKPRKQFSWRVPILGAVSRSSIPMPSLTEPGDRPVEWQPVIARLQPNLFPDNPIALEGLTSLYLNSEKALDLKVNQVNALLSWLYQGGHLVVGIDQVLHVNGNEWLRQLLPCELTALSHKAKHAEIREWLRSSRLYTGVEYPYESSASRTDSTTAKPSRRTNTPEPVTNPYLPLTDDVAFEKIPLQVATGTVRDGSVLIGSTESPLAVIARRGRGQITVLNFSPELEPFVSWKNRSWFWAKIMGVPPELFALKQMNTYFGYSIDSVLGAMIDTKQVRKLPVGWLLLLLVGYLVVIGPVDQYWLKKINRQMLTWLTFPAYVAGFSVLIYLIGYKLRAGETEWNELHVVDIIPVGEKADLRGRAYASVYSPANARYKLASDQPFAALRGEYQRGQETSKATVEQHGNSFEGEISVPVWTSQLYVGDWLRRDDPPLTLAVSSDSSQYYLQVNNHLENRIRQARVVIDGKVFPLPEIPAKQNSEFKLPRNAGSPLSSFVQSYGGNFHSIASQRQQAFGGNQHFVDMTNGVIAASFISQYNAQATPSQQLQYNYASGFVTTPGLDLLPLVRRGDAVLLAWVPNYCLVKPMNQFSPRRTHKDTLLRISAEVKPLKLEGS